MQVGLALDSGGHLCSDSLAINCSMVECFQEKLSVDIWPNRSARDVDHVMGY